MNNKYLNCNHIWALNDNSFKCIKCGYDTNYHNYCNDNIYNYVLSGNSVLVNYELAIAIYDRINNLDRELNDAQKLKYLRAALYNMLVKNQSIERKNNIIKRLKLTSDYDLWKGR